MFFYRLKAITFTSNGGGEGRVSHDEEKQYMPKSGALGLNRGKVSTKVAGT